MVEANRLTRLCQLAMVVACSCAPCQAAEGGIETKVDPRSIQAKRDGTYTLNGRPVGGPNESHFWIGWIAEHDISCPSECTAIRLPDGRLFAVGGDTWNNPLGSRFLKTDNWVDNAIYGRAQPEMIAGPRPLLIGRKQAVSTVLQNGQVLIMGGYVGDYPKCVSTRHTEIFDPRTNKFSRTGDLIHARRGANAVTLRDGRVLVTGGTTDNGAVVEVAEIFDPLRGKFNEIGKLNHPRMGHTALLLQDGRVMLIGGFGPKLMQGVAEIEYFDPSLGRFIDSVAHRAGDVPKAILLQDGSVLIFDGTTWGTLPARLDGKPSLMQTWVPTNNARIIVPDPK